MNNMNIIHKASILLVISMSFISCESLVDGVNKNPNSVSVSDVETGLYVNTPELALVGIERGINSYIAALWTGQIIGTNQFPLAYYNYQVTESTFDFNGYQSVITQAKYIQKSAPDNKFYQGITRIMEAYLFGTYASLYGDIPCTEVSTDVDYPKFEGQIEVFAYVQKLLDEAISYLDSETSVQFKQDYFFNGNINKWKETAYTLKARYFTITKEYSNAYESALNGISTNDNSLFFRPIDDNQTSNKNNYWTYTQNQYLGTNDLNGKQCFLFNELDKHNNNKTDETARKAYYYIDPNNATQNKGFASKLEPEPLVTYSENLLILAESGTRTQGFDIGLKYLNTLRDFYNKGGNLNKYYSSYGHKYDSYTNEDFQKDGILNSDGILPTRALLREIILERYLSSFLTLTAFDDARRLRGAGESDIAVPIPLNNSTATKQPERFYYPETEMLSNINAPKDPGIYAPTAVNSK